ncbi:MAG: hypothetical protein KJI71_05525 [Patescibacteria group bacterium]|nr:hypothetical protein [Patescibacteria group bacterium]
MAQKYYSQHKSSPITEEEIKEKYNDIQEEMEEVLKWKKEEETKLKDIKASPQKKGAIKRALKKIAWRINTVQGQTIYWKFRVNGESHFKANLEKNEFWASCKQKAEEEQRKKDEIELPELLKKKL